MPTTPITLDPRLRRAIDDLRRMNLALLLIAGVLLAVGVVFIYGTGQQTGGSFAGKWLRQLVWIGLGTGLMLGLAVLDYRNLGRAAWWIYGGAIVLLVTVLLVGETRNNARSWLPLLPGMNLQPSEPAKLGLLIATAWLAARPYMRFRHARDLAPFALLTALPVWLIAAQPDLGSAMVLVPMTCAVVFVSGLRLRHLLAIVALALIVSPLFYRYGLSDYQRQRLYTFLRPSRNPTKEGWNARQSRLAVGSGGWRGKGFMHGTQNVLGFLPRKVAPTDFIFSVIAEETGFLGSALVVAAFTVLLVLCLYIASKAPDPFGRNLACGIAILFSTHIYINVGMTMGVAPIIGIPLPFVSYGGSFMILVLACVGILQSVYIRRDVH